MYACDDGNLLNKDGCSAECQIESDWSCTGGSKTSPDVCVETKKPFSSGHTVTEATNSDKSDGIVVEVGFSETVVIDPKISLSFNCIKKASYSYLLSEDSSKIIVTMLPEEDIPQDTNLTIKFD